MGRISRLLRAAWRYVKYDLREHIAPSAIPDPPDSPAGRRAAAWAALSAREKLAFYLRELRDSRGALREGWAMYKETWRREFRPRPSDRGDGGEGSAEPGAGDGAPADPNREPGLLEELGEWRG